MSYFTIEPKCQPETAGQTGFFASLGMRTKSLTSRRSGGKGSIDRQSGPIHCLNAFPKCLGGSFKKPIPHIETLYFTAIILPFNLHASGFALENS